MSACDAECWSIVDGINTMAEYNLIAAIRRAYSSACNIEAFTTAVINPCTAINQNYGKIPGITIVIFCWQKSKLRLWVNNVGI